MKNLFFALVFSALSLNAYAAGSVAGTDDVGASRVLDRDTSAVLDAVAANPDDFAELTRDGRFVFAVKIAILPARTANYSNVTRYTLTSSERGGFLGGPQPLKHFRLVLDSFFDKRVMDDSPTIWKSSGVQEVRQ